MCIIKRNKLIFFMLSLVLRVIMDIYYLSYVSPNWSYMGLETEINISKYLISYGLQVVISILLDWEDNRFSSYSIRILYIVMLTPLLSFYALGNKDSMYAIWAVLSFSITIITVKFFPRKSIKEFIPRIRMNKKVLLIPVGIMIVLSICMAVSGKNINIGALNIFNSELVYEVRRNVKGPSGIWAYLFGWTYRVFMPLVLAYCCYKKKYIYSMIILACSLFLYMINPHKEILLGNALVLFMSIVAKKYERGKVFLLGCILSLGIWLFMYLSWNSKIAFYGLDLLMRLFHIPATNKYMHYEYFSIFPKLFFSEGKIGRFFGVSYPYDVSVGTVVCRFFFGVEGNNNVGYLAYAYGDMGFFEMVLESVLLALVLKLGDLCIGNDIAYMTPALTYLIISLNDESFFQWLLTGGALFAIVLILIFRNHCDRREQKCNLPMKHTMDY